MKLNIFEFWSMNQFQNYIKPKHSQIKQCLSETIFQTGIVLFAVFRIIFPEAGAGGC
ncbi:amidohydrolase [Neisseria wadsworthii 9715]|uniref:Amidohydrolase n=1 Tax=Neisseria wadsworthii 9715 TaxID=1030841 RepID=G4CRP9_9NEIS|nr:amidohydrolase [Neisseria wadsworthii 9715]